MGVKCFQKLQVIKQKSKGQVWCGVPPYELLGRPHKPPNQYRLIATDLGGSPELDGKTLHLKTLNTWVAGHKKNQEGMSWNFLPTG